MNTKINTKEKGFVSIFAIFFSAIVVSVLTALYILLIKQIELMSYDTGSFQSLYTADSSFECVLFKEQNSTGTKSMFLQGGTSFDNCQQTGDASLSTIGRTIGTGRDASTLNVSMDTQAGSFCGVVYIDKNYKDTSGFTLPPGPDTLVVMGQNRACTDSTSTKVIEREIDLYY